MCVPSCHRRECNRGSRRTPVLRCWAPTPPSRTHKVACSQTSSISSKASAWLFWHPSSTQSTPSTLTSSLALQTPVSGRPSGDCASCMMDCHRVWLEPAEHLWTSSWSIAISSVSPAEPSVRASRPQTEHNVARVSANAFWATAARRWTACIRGRTSSSCASNFMSSRYACISLSSLVFSACASRRRAASDAATPASSASFLHSPEPGSTMATRSTVKCACPKHAWTPRIDPASASCRPSVPAPAFIRGSA